MLIVILNSDVTPPIHHDYGQNRAKMRTQMLVSAENSFNSFELLLLFFNFNNFYIKNDLGTHFFQLML